MPSCSNFYANLIFQAPVSDREYRATLPETAEMIDLAAKMIGEGHGMDLMPREANPDVPITAYRYSFMIKLRNICDKSVLMVS